DAARVPVTFRYEARTPDGDISYTADVRLGRDAPTLVFFPAFWDEYFVQFRGVEVAQSDVDCLAGFFRVRPNRVPDVVLDAVLAPDWRTGKLYAPLARFETPRRGADAVAQVALPPTLSVAARTPPLPFAADARMELRDIVARRPDGALVVTGRPAPGAYT